METPFDPKAVFARIEMLEGQTRSMRAVLAAVIASHPDPARAAAVMTVTWSDLQEKMSRPQSDAAKSATQHNMWNGARSAWNDLQEMLSSIPPRVS